MKAVVLEIKGDFVAVLSDDGVFSKVKNNNYEVGQVIIMKKTSISFKKKIATISAAAAVITLCVLSGVLYYMPVEYVSLDVNPSIEYGVNLFDTVVKVEGINEDGAKLIENLDLKGEDVETAINNTIDELIDKGYVDQDPESDVVISTSGGNIQKAEKLANRLKEQAQIHISEQGKIAQVEAFAIGKERVAQAKELGVTPGKLNLVEKLIASSESPEKIDMNEWLDKSVKDINKAIKENRGKKPGKEDSVSKDKGNDSSQEVSSEDNSSSEATSESTEEATTSQSENVEESSANTSSKAPQNNKPNNNGNKPKTNGKN